MAHTRKNRTETGQDADRDQKHTSPQRGPNSRTTFRGSATRTLRTPSPSFWSQNQQNFGQKKGKHTRAPLALRIRPSMGCSLNSRTLQRLRALQRAAIGEAGTGSGHRRHVRQRLVAAPRQAAEKRKTASRQHGGQPEGGSDPLTSSQLQNRPKLEPRLEEETEPATHAGKTSWSAQEGGKWSRRKDGGRESTGTAECWIVGFFSRRFFFVVGYCLEPSRFTDRTEKFPIREKSCSRAARTHEESHGEKKVRGYHAAPDERGPSSSAPAPSASIFFQPRPASTPFIFVFRFFYDSFSDRMECKYVECGERGERGRKKVTTFKKKI